MIKLITITLFSLLLVACNYNGTENKNVIVGKAYNAGTGFAELPEGICYYEINGNYFQDSCNKYSIGDTIQ